MSGGCDYPSIHSIQTPIFLARIWFNFLAKKLIAQL